MNITLQSIGIVRTPFKKIADMPVQPKGGEEVTATIEFDSAYHAGLKDLDGFSHVYLIYYFHKITTPQLQVVPFHDKTNTPRGVFSTRTPMHPNSIGLSVVQLVSVENGVVTIRGVDILDGTPLLDIKPYIENFDRVDGEVTSGWMQSTRQEVRTKRSDNRFEE